MRQEQVMDTRQVLERAKTLIEGGWCQNANTDGNGNFCLRAAIGLASGAMAERNGFVYFKDGPNTLPMQKDDLAAKEALIDQLINQLPDDALLSIPFWNDLPTTTQADVIDLLDRAIAAC